MSRSDLDVAALRADPLVVWTRDVLRFRDTDMNGHVNNSTFSVFCESGRVNFLHHVLKGGREPGTFFVVARLAIDFRAELHYPGDVRCGTWIAALGRSSMTFHQTLLDDAGTLVASAEGVVVHMDHATRRPKPLGEAMREMIAPMVRA